MNCVCYKFACVFTQSGRRGEYFAGAVELKRGAGRSQVHERLERLGRLGHRIVQIVQVDHSRFASIHHRYGISLLN